MKTPRDIFRESVFARDKNLCVICGAAGQDAHHILERRLFPDGGYNIDNGATLCGEHHLDAESTILSCETIREKAGIDKTFLPPHLYRDNRYDKWGNIILPNGKRIKGELFFDESVQKIMGRDFNLKEIFLDYVKYPRTFHLPWSEGLTSDDRVMADTRRFHGKRVIGTEKRDGENSNFYPDYYHARSLEPDNHWSKTWAKNFHAKIAGDIPYGWRVCAENLFAAHSIKYDKLDSYVEAFSIWDERNNCLSWDDTVLWAEAIGLHTVPVIYDGIYDEEAIKKLWTPTKPNGEEMEGYVIRVADSFSYGEFSQCVGKFVRRGHVTSSHHWKDTAKKNGLKS